MATELEAAFLAGRWRADWIWADDAPRDGRHVVALQKQFELADVPARAPARWCAVSRVTLYVNGVEIGRGPVRSNPRTQPADDIDLAPYLHAGTNTVAALVTSYGGPTAWYLPPPVFSNHVARGAFVFEARLGETDWLVSDTTWHARALANWTAMSGGGVSGRGREFVDANTLDADWQTGPVDWAPAVVQDSHAMGEPGLRKPPTYPIGPFGGRPIAWPVPNDVALKSVGQGGWIADRVTPGTIVIDAEGPAGAVVAVTTSEFLVDGQPSPNEHDASVAFTLDGTRRVLESFDYYGGQGVQVETPDNVTVHSVTIRERLYPVAPGASFECSDDLLNTIWSVGRRSVTINSFDAYTDCPTREQRAWTGDSVVHQMVDLTTNFDWRLARRHPRLTAVPRADGMLPMAVGGDIEFTDFTIIPDWALHWVHSVWNLYRYCGDRDEIANLLGVVEGVVRWFLQFCDEDGLPTDVYGWVIIDWSAMYTDGVSSALCGLWGRALLEFAEMSTWLGDKGRAKWAKETHAKLAKGFERLWDKKRKRYVDHIGELGDPGVASQAGQTAAIIGGLAPKRRHGRLVDVITDRTNHVAATFSAKTEANAISDAVVGGGYLRRGHPKKQWWDQDKVVTAQPFFRYAVHDALVAAGRADLIVDQCRDWAVALDRCPTSWTECWFGGTISHGWSSTPTRDLMQRVLGVTPAEPGFAAAQVEPNLGDLTWARGVLPSPAGPISVSIDASSVAVDSPVPIVYRGERHAAGSHTLPR